MPRDSYEGQLLDGRYLLERLVDTGSFGAVYAARDRKLDRVVAVKILFDQDESAFRKEARLAVRFEHRNVVKVFDYGADDQLNVGYIVMEFLKGRRLDQILEDHHGRLPWSMIAQFTDEIGSALQLAHERQLVHRDLKPRNVMLVDDGSDDPRFVLLDLGLASQLNSTSTLRNEALDGALSPHYASPEQFHQAAVDYQSDIYSFGTILFELVAGEIPFNREQLPALMMAICHEAPPDLRTVATDREVPAELDAVVQQCLEKDPLRRPKSIRDIRLSVLRALPEPGAGARAERSVAGDLASRETGHGSGSAPPFPTGTLPPPAQLTGSGSGDSTPTDRQAWRGSTPLRRSEPRRSPVGPALVAVVVVVAAGLTLWSVWPGGSPEPAAGAGQMIVAEALNLRPGREASLQVFVEPPDDWSGGEPSLAVMSCPSWLEITVPETLPPKTLVDLPVRAEHAAESRDGTLTLRVSAGEWSEDRSIRVQAAAVAVWPLPTGFEAAEETRLASSDADGRTFYREIERIVEGQPPLRVKFVLIDPPRDGSAGRPAAPFYVMETKVWNSLFTRFDAETSGETSAGTDADSEEWKLGALAGGKNLGVADHPQLPVVRVSPRLAHRFAVWLTGSGHLPSREQWDLASGIRHRSADPQSAESWPEGPFRGHYQEGVTEVAIDRAQSGPLPVGSAADDVTITGIRDMAGNGQELTETLMNGGRVGDVAARGGGGSLIRVLLRGRSYFSSHPLTWEDLQQTSELPEAVGYTEFSPDIGFRVVLETTE